MPSLCRKGFGLAAWQKAARTSPQLSLSRSHISVEPWLSLPNHPADNDDKLYHLHFWKLPQTKERWEGFSAFHRSWTYSKMGAVTWKFAAHYSWTRGCTDPISKIKVWSEAGSSGTLFMCHALQALAAVPVTQWARNCAAQVLVLPCSELAQNTKDLRELQFCAYPPDHTL